MAAYLITGKNGTGKSAVAAALKNLGYTAFDTDHMPGLTSAVDPKTGATVTPDPAHPHTLSYLDWNWDGATLKTLLATQDDVFICAITTNQAMFYPLFTKIFVLTLPTRELTRRLLTRTTEDYGKQPDELQQILSTYNTFTQDLIQQGAIPIDAQQHAETIAREIVEHISDH